MPPGENDDIQANWPETEIRPSRPTEGPAGEATTLPPAIDSAARGDTWETTLLFAGGGASLPAPSQTSVPGYEILGELGRGGMGVVYKARHLQLKRLVALKMILAGGHAGDQERMRFRAEEEAVARLQHPNIVQIYEVGEHQGLPFFSLEFCSGGSLSSQLDGTPWSPTRAAQLIETLARAVQHAHEKGIIHRDLKPANVLLAEDGTPKITDFGLAKQLDAAGQTCTGTVMGTPSYMAPEQAGGKSKEMGPGTDIYALGAILYDLLVGKPPFKAANALDTIMQVVTDDPIPPRQLFPDIPRSLESICLKCLEKDPRRRYGSARDLADDLRRFLDGEQVLARPLGVIGALARWAHQRPALAATMAGLGVFYVNHLFLALSGIESVTTAFHGFVTALILVWLAGAIAFQWLADRPRWRWPAIYGWSALDVIMLTTLLLQADGPRSGLVVGYFLLIAGAALRFRMALVWLVTALSVAGYIGVQADALWHRTDQHMAVPPHTAVIVVTGLLVMGLIIYLILRRVRIALAED